MSKTICADTGEEYSTAGMCAVEILLDFGKRPFTPDELKYYRRIVAAIAAATQRVAKMTDAELLAQ
jgi:hypothetical protein